jgi:type VI secretion system FHA domain protein
VGIVLVIRAVSFKGRPVGRELAARFGEAGGTIGRGEGSTLVLPDPERYISRTHATISFQAGGFIITDSGTKNPVTLNGRPLGLGSQARLANGDTIKVGDYTLEVTLAPRVVPQIPPAEVGAARGSGPPKDDPLAVLGGPASKAVDPFADLLKPAEPAAPRPGPVIPPSADPAIASRPEPASPRTPEPLPPDPLAGIRGREPSIDEVFGLKPSGERDLLGPEPSVGRPLGQPEAEVVDPLQILGGPAKPVPPPAVPDHGPEIFAQYAPPVAKPDPALEARAPAASPAAQPSAPPASVEPRAQPASAVPAGSVEEALLRALLQGAGIPDAPLPKGLTPETMEAIGKLLREAVQGTLDLLRIRGHTKSEMRADVTMIMALDNNPLKFSPTAEAALVHLLASPVRGFMPPLRAMKDAYDDLRAHELGFLAGMRAALEEVLARFAPEELERRLSDPTVLDSLLPMNRKAKLWELFVERYRDVAGEAREDFNTAFGKAFLRAYEAQVKQLRGEGHRG